MMLRGRNEQCRLIDALIAEARRGRSRVMVLRGEPGIGKSALMQYAAETGPDFHVARADGVEAEMELPYAAVHQLCRPIRDRLDRLPGPRRPRCASPWVCAPDHRRTGSWSALPC